MTVALAMPASALSISARVRPISVGLQTYTNNNAIAVFGIVEPAYQPQTFGCANNVLYIDLGHPFGKPAFDTVMSANLTGVGLARIDFTIDASNLCWVHLIQTYP